jgi:hypothetical protein
MPMSRSQLVLIRSGSFAEKHQHADDPFPSPRRLSDFDVAKMPWQRRGAKHVTVSKVATEAAQQLLCEPYSPLNLKSIEATANPSNLFVQRTSSLPWHTHDQRTLLHAVITGEDIVMASKKFVATINSTGRQSASFIRVASAAGWHVRAHVQAKEGSAVEELASLPNVELIVGDLTGPGLTNLLKTLFIGVRIAFVNTTHWGDEIAIGNACADAAKKAGIAHYVYSSMPDHSVYGKGWQALPMWTTKFAIENYVRQLEIPATFIYTGIYNNDFTSLPNPLFQMELQDDGSFIWQAPFHPDDPLPWLDVEHDFGPALLEIFKMGAYRWKGQVYVRVEIFVKL